MVLLQDRRERSLDRLNGLRRDLEGAAGRAEGKACIYVTGSFGRLEAGEHSDLDLFIAVRHGADGPQLKRLDEIRIKADLIDATARHGLPEFSGDGRYLQSYTDRQLVTAIGTPEDDAQNTLTARLLLLLESRCLLGNVVYEDVIRNVVEAYWRDYGGHESEFTPSYLINDILRLWRTFCVNYEANTKREPEAERLDAKIKNYKLRFSRLLTCYSAVLHLLHVHASSGAVTHSAAVEMSGMTPTERLEALRLHSGADTRRAVERMLELYDSFLNVTSAPKTELRRVFADQSQDDALRREARAFGDAVAEAVIGMRSETPLARHVVV